ncbi:hypothetical protein ICW40_04725 [Actinotalea ferrariae]|uniref:hypothetical protein n=1 Tax=Actinotalea ferrariae TaxID=1386098 RepID=UPI001C8B8D81|nr:hypothetical protein [Actinotalea ferrariae]MBX9244111.1 hypothetical protein [Actinotalea ferrariae]
MQIVELRLESPERAAEFCAYTIAREPWFLAELARWMADTGGPLEQMDATAESLVPLWEWFISFVDADLPGLPADAVWALSPVVDHRLPVRACAAGERVMHYVRLVLEHYEPEAQWTVLGGTADYAHFQDTGLPWPQRADGIQPWEFVLNLASHVGEGTARFRQATALAEVVRSVTGTTLSATSGDERGASVLASYLSADLGPMPEFARVSPVVRWWAEDDAGHAPARTAPEPLQGGFFEREDRVLAAGSGRAIAEERDDRLRPLDVEQVAAALTAIGFTAGDGAVGAQHLLDEQPVSVHTEDLQATAEPACHRGSLRRLDIAGPLATDQGWERLESTMTALARQLRARYTDPDAFD